jgi:hypothetical protein
MRELDKGGGYLIYGNSFALRKGGKDKRTIRVNMKIENFYKVYIDYIVWDI